MHRSSLVASYFAAVVSSSPLLYLLCVDVSSLPALWGRGTVPGNLQRSAAVKGEYGKRCSLGLMDLLSGWILLWIEYRVDVQYESALLWTRVG